MVLFYKITEIRAQSWCSQKKCQNKGLYMNQSVNKQKRVMNVLRHERLIGKLQFECIGPNYHKRPIFILIFILIFFFCFKKEKSPQKNTIFF